MPSTLGSCAISLSSGSQTVLITDANACNTSISIVLTEPTPLQTTIVSTTDYNTYDISCDGYSDGGLDLTVTGSVPGYNYLWNTGQPDPGAPGANHGRLGPGTSTGGLKSMSSIKSALSRES